MLKDVCHLILGFVHRLTCFMFCAKHLLASLFVIQVDRAAVCGRATGLLILLSLLFMIIDKLLLSLEVAGETHA